jgi:hypothetical protein
MKNLHATGHFTQGLRMVRDLLRSEGTIGRMSRRCIGFRLGRRECPVSRIGSILARSRGSFFQIATEDKTMKARLLSNVLCSGNAARDFLRIVQNNPYSLTSNSRPHGQAAHVVLESFEEQNKQLWDEPAPPVKSLTSVLTRTLQEIPNSSTGNRKEIGAWLFKGCRVRLVGIPERSFIVDTVFWDYESVRVREVGTEIYYTIPWDAVEYSGKK